MVRMRMRHTIAKVLFIIADVSDGEIVDEEGEDNAEVAQAVEAAMVAARRQAQGRVSRDDDVVVLESSEDDDNDDEEGIDDGNDEEGDRDNERCGDKNMMRQEDEEDPEEVMEDIVEDQESSQLQYPEQSDDRRTTATVSSGIRSSRGGNSIVPEFGDMTATSSERIPGDSSQDAGLPPYQQLAPESSSSGPTMGSHGPEAQASSQFEDDKDDSVVPSTPKLGEEFVHSSRGVPGSSNTVLNLGTEDARSGGSATTASQFGRMPANAFVFGSHGSARGETFASSNVSSSSSRSNFAITSGGSGTVPDLASQEGLDRTSVDIAQFSTNPVQVGSRNDPTTGDSSTVLISSAATFPLSAQVSSPSTSQGIKYIAYIDFLCIKF